MFVESLDEGMIVGHAGINQMLQKQVTQKRSTKQVATASDDRRSYSEFDEACV